jgi:adenylate kinase
MESLSLSITTYGKIKCGLTKPARRKSVNERRDIETLPADEFERIVEQFIEKAATWD